MLLLSGSSVPKPPVPAEEVLGLCFSGMATDFARAPGDCSACLLFGAEIEPIASPEHIPWPLYPLLRSKIFARVARDLTQLLVDNTLEQSAILSQNLSHPRALSRAASWADGT